MLVERVNVRMRGLLDVLIAPVSYLVHVVVDRHLFGKNIHVKCDFHIALLRSKVTAGASPLCMQAGAPSNNQPL